MSIHLGQVLLTAVVGLLVMESYQTTPWLADKLMRWSVRLRYTDNPERATVRGEELISFLEDLPTLFKLPTAGGFLFRAVAYRLVHRRSHAKREPRTGQRSLDARFRIVFVGTSMLLGLELLMLYGFFEGREHLLALCAPLGILSGILATSGILSRSPRLRPGSIAP